MREASSPRRGLTGFQGCSSFSIVKRERAQDIPGKRSRGGTPAHTALASRELVAIDGDLGAVLTLVTVILVGEQIVQVVLHSVPGKCPGLTPLLDRERCNPFHDLRVSIAELAENVLNAAV